MRCQNQLIVILIQHLQIRMVGYLKFFCRIFKANRDLSFPERILRAYDKTILYRELSIKQYEQILTMANQVESSKPNSLKQGYQMVSDNVSKLISKVKSIEASQYIPMQPKQINFNNVVNEAQLKNNSQKMFQFILSHSVIFYNSIQALVQGRREVMSNPQLKLWDEETVQQKQDKFQAKVKYILDKINVKK